MKPHEKQLRRLVWSYIILLVFEGALRKWFLPGFSNILILAREPIVILAYTIALAHGVFPRNKFVISGLVIVGLSFVATMLFGHGDLYIAAYGFRANIFHLPFAFIIGAVFYRRDVIYLGKYWLWCTLAMTALICLQFNSPQSAWVNVGPGGYGSAGFGGAMGKYRPPGTFTFIIGIVWFYAFSAAFLSAAVTQHKRYSKSLIALSAFAIVLAIPVSISRMLILSVALTFAISILVSATQKNSLLRFARIAFVALVGVFMASQLPVFDEAREAFMSRWNDASGENYGGVKNAVFMRVIKEFTGPFSGDNNLEFFGVGLGAGTQIGSELLIGKRNFHLGEGEWYRLTGESGIALAIPYILWRVLLFAVLLKFCLRNKRKGDGLPLILLSATGYNLLVGPFGQSTVLGFTVIGVGLTIASMRSKDSDIHKSEEGASTTQCK